ncbi:hypothetical protein D3C78_1353360 [compost metagenome]
MRSIIPLERGTGIVPSFDIYRLHHLIWISTPLYFFTIHIQYFNIPIILNRGEADIGHTDFLALVNKRCTLLHMQKSSEHLCRYLAILSIITESGHHTRLIVIVQI